MNIAIFNPILPFQCKYLSAIIYNVIFRLTRERGREKEKEGEREREREREKKKRE